MACDPFGNLVVLACRFNGANGSTTFTDENGHTLTAYGNAQLTTTSPKFGTACLALDGASDYASISSASAADFDFGTGDFTVEAWVWFNVMPTSDAWPSSWSSHMVVFAHGVTGAAAGYGLVIGQTKIMWSNNDPQVAVGTHGMTTGQWYHVAAVRRGGVVSTFVDGQLKGVSEGITTNYTYAQPSWVGCETGDGAWFNGKIDDLRITKAARYTGDFTPPPIAFKDYALAGDENALVFDRVVPS